MNLKNLNLRQLLLACNLLASNQVVLATSSDHQQPIHIAAAQQTLNMATNTVTITGDVVIKRGSIDMQADKVVITRTDSTEVVEGYGNPVTFYQLQEDGKPVRGYSRQMRYETANDLVILTGNAYLEQLDNNVKGDYITYLIKQKKMAAFSNKGNRVTTVLIPAQLQDKRVQKEQTEQITITK